MLRVDFITPITVSMVIAGTALFRPPCDTRNTITIIVVVAAFPYNLCRGPPFPPPQIASAAIAGTALFQSPRGTRNTTSIIMIVVVIVHVCRCLYVRTGGISGMRLSLHNDIWAIIINE